MLRDDPKTDIAPVAPTRKYIMLLINLRARIGQSREKHGAAVLVLQSVADL